jgi:hypothetical protein
MDDAYVCQECGAVVPHYNTIHDYKDCQIVKLRQRLEAAEYEIKCHQHDRKILEDEIFALRKQVDGLKKERDALWGIVTSYSATYVEQYARIKELLADQEEMAGGGY